MVSAASVRLADYRPWPFVLSTIRMDVDIRAEDVVVSSRLELTPQEGADTLELWGVDLEICSIRLDGEELADAAYSYVDQRLSITSLPVEPFVLETCCRIDPYNNSSLEGLCQWWSAEHPVRSGGIPADHLPPGSSRCPQSLDGADRGAT